MFKSVIKRLFRRCGMATMASHTFDGICDDIGQLQAEITRVYGENQDLHGKNRDLRLKQGNLQSTIEYLQERVRAFEQRESEAKQRAKEQAAKEEQLQRLVTREHDAYMSVLEQLRRLQIGGDSSAVNPLAPREGDQKTQDTTYDARHWTRLGKEAQVKEDRDRAIACYAQAVSLIHRYEPARDRMREISASFLREAEEFGKQGQLPEAKRALVRAIELNPVDANARQALADILKYNREYDVTKDCFVYHDPVRGKAVYREAFLRAAEYVAGAGLLGEFLEFGVLGGFTARLQCEIMRDLLIWKQIHLFDSFEGLPPYESAVDRGGYDTAVRNIWDSPMCIGEDFCREQLGLPIDVYIFNRLSEVISPDRIFIYRGFFSKTLPTMPNIKAALVHIDCDLYQSTREVFTSLYEKDVFQDGCVILFDDYNCFRANPAFGERRAFREFLEGQDRYTCSPFYTYGWNGAAFILHDRTVTP